MVLANVVAAVVLAGQDQPKRMFDPAENYNKTAGQVVAMGYDAWYDFVIEKEGSETTMSMAGANYSFGCALHDVNDDRMKVIAKERRAMIVEMRPKMEEFRDNCQELGIAMSGGGTLWTVIGSGNLHAVEETVAELIAANPKAKKQSQSKVWDMLSSTEKKLATLKEEIEGASEFTHIGYGEAEATLKKMKFGWSEAIPMIAKFDSMRDRGRIMWFYHDSIEMARSMEE